MDNQFSKQEKIPVPGEISNIAEIPSLLIDSKVFEEVFVGEQLDTIRDIQGDITEAERVLIPLQTRMVVVEQRFGTGGLPNKLRSLASHLEDAKSDLDFIAQTAKKRLRGEPVEQATDSRVKIKLSELKNFVIKRDLAPKEIRKEPPRVQGFKNFRL